MSTVAGDGTNGITFYFSLGRQQQRHSHSKRGQLGCVYLRFSGSSTPANCVVSYKVDGTASSVATGSVPSRVLQCPGGAVNPTQFQPPSTATSCLPRALAHMAPQMARTVGSCFFKVAPLQPTLVGEGAVNSCSPALCTFILEPEQPVEQNTSCLSMNGGSGSGAFTLGNIVVDKLNMTGNSGLTMILNLR